MITSLSVEADLPTLRRLAIEKVQTDLGSKCAYQWSRPDQAVRLPMIFQHFISVAETGNGDNGPYTAEVCLREQPYFDFGTPKPSPDRREWRFNIKAFYKWARKNLDKFVFLNPSFDLKESETIQYFGSVAGLLDYQAAKCQARIERGDPHVVVNERFIHISVQGLGVVHYWEIPAGLDTEKQELVDVEFNIQDTSPEDTARRERAILQTFLMAEPDEELAKKRFRETKAVGGHPRFLNGDI